VARLGRGEALLAILVLPAAAPVLIAGVRSTEAILEEGTLSAAAPWPAVALTTMVVYAAIGGLLYESVLVE
jgi:ABC-type transport system involved in cytochrome c biogenesis permease component